MNLFLLILNKILKIMKELMFLMLFVCCTQFTNHKTDVNCGIVTDKFAPPLDTKSSCGSIPISYNANELIVIMPPGKDSIEVKKYLKENKYLLLEVCKYNTSLQLHSRPAGSDGVAPPKSPPKPIIGERTFKNTIVLNQQGLATTQFRIMSHPIMFK